MKQYFTLIFTIMFFTPLLANSGALSNTDNKINNLFKAFPKTEHHFVYGGPDISKVSLHHAPTMIV